MVHRDEFESWSSAKQKKYAKIRYKAVRKELLQDCLENGKFRDDTGGLISETHHCYSRAQSSLWWYFQRENLLPVSAETHYALHNIPANKWTESVRSMARKAEEIRKAIYEREVNRSN